MELWREGRALKASLRGEGTSLKVAGGTGSHHQVQVQLQVVSDELTRASSTEDFSVECFLDFSQDRRLLLQEDTQENQILSLSSSSQEQDCNFASQASIFDQFPSFPDEEVEELEWVSRVVDDSSSPEVSLLFTQKKPQELETHKRKPCFSSPIPVKPRTKRARSSLTVPKLWPLFSSPSNTHEKPVTSVFQRRCSHCGTNNTPQWRSGPLGPKTLCNACGVRYKSGRLCPEYRPADSPSFSNHIHSNLHRKVLELRKSKELGETGESTEQNKSNLATSRKT